MNLRVVPYWLFAFLVLLGAIALWRIDVLGQLPYGSSAMGNFTQASAIAHGDVDGLATPAASMYRHSVVPSLLAGLMKFVPAGTPLVVSFRLLNFGLGAIMLLAMVAFLQRRAGWGGASIVAAAVMTAPIVTVQMELMDIDFIALVLSVLAGLLLMSGRGGWGGVVGFAAACCQWTSVSYLVAGLVYSVAMPLAGRARVGRGSIVSHGLALMATAILLWSGYDSSLYLGGWVAAPDFGTSPLVDVWMWGPDLLVLLGGLVVAVAALGDWRTDQDLELRPSADGFSYFDPPILLGLLIVVGVAVRLGLTGATPADLSLVIPFVMLAAGWLAFSWPTYQTGATAFFFGLVAFQLINSTGMYLPPLPNTIDFRTSTLRERSREYLFTDHALIVEGLKSLLEQSRESPVATVAPLVHCLSLPALGYVAEPMRGYSLGGPTTPMFEPIERLRNELPADLAIVYFRNRYGANHEWTIPLPERGDEFIYPRTKERREEERWKISPIFVYKPRQVPSETAEETRRRYLRRFWPTAAAIARAEQLAEVGRPKEAEIVLRQILQGSPANHSARYQLGLLMEGREDWDSAKEQYAKIPLGAAEYWQAMSQSAMIEMSRENFDAADRAFKDAIDAFRKLPKQSPRPLATLFVRWAIGDLERQAWASAEQKLRQATSIDPTFSVAFRELGLVLLNVNKLEESRSILQRSIELDVEDSLSHFYLASTFARLNEWEAARGAFAETLKINPENWDAQQGLCESLLRLKRYEESAVECDGALSRLPKEQISRRALLLITLADAQRGKGDWSSAIVTLRRAVDAEETTKLAANHLAWLLSTSPIDEWRNGEEAVQLMEQLAANPETPSAYLDTLAAAYAETGNWEKAVSTMQRAIERRRQEDSSSSLTDFENRLASYERQEPFRDQTPP